MTTLAFAPAGVSPAALTLARPLGEDAPSDPAPGTADVVPVQPAAPPAPGHGPGAHPVPAPAPDLPAIYEYVIDHLRRDLLVERERMGDLLGELP
jgi:hypothetical protein